MLLSCHSELANGLICGVGDAAGALEQAAATNASTPIATDRRSWPTNSFIYYPSVQRRTLRLFVVKRYGVTPSPASFAWDEEAGPYFRLVSTFARRLRALSRPTSTKLTS